MMSPSLTPEGALPSAFDSDVHRDKLSVVGHMTSSIAHDLNNPLATIITSAETMLADWPEAGALAPPALLLRLRADLELILGETRRAATIIGDLLSFARQEPPTWRPMAAAEIVRRTVAIARHRAQHYGITIHATTDDEGFGTPAWTWVNGDASRLQQVLLNLMINAQQAIRSVRATGNIWVRLAQVEDHVSVSVEDDGPGIPADLRAKIFEPYFTTKRSGEGTGLGLSIASRIIEQHQGRLRVSDREPRGAIFAIDLPIVPHDDSPELPKAAGPRTWSQRTHRIRVLLVDDEAGIRRSISRFLRRIGCDVDTASTGLEALSCLRDTTYDALITDVRMPGLGGEELYGEIERAFAYLTRRVIFVSGDMMRKETQEFIARVGCPSLEKPYELNDLVDALNRVCPDDAPAPVIPHEVGA
jgi:nitrogen-specific signal transduction histidine kinase/CheY-like chemotaxis protein